ncbi:MAG: DUF1788 domain-containing protein [Methanogenium sp.]|nr:DUF1788 domain-containing protein [Methanogenium sp.]
MSSLESRFANLESKLKKQPLKLNSIKTLPFLIFHYNPGDEWKLRRMVKNIGIQLENEGRHIVYLSMEKLLWESLGAIEQHSPIEGYNAVVKLEKDSGFLEAQDQIITYFSDNDRCPIVEQIAKRLESLDPKKHIVFLIHVAAMAPDLYQTHVLLDKLEGKTMVPIILFYPGSLDGITGLRFMDMRDREPMGNYRVEIL